MPKIIAESADGAVTFTQQERKVAKKPETPPTQPTDAEIEERKKQVAESAETIHDGLFGDNKKKPEPKVDPKLEEQPTVSTTTTTTAAPQDVKPKPAAKPAPKTEKSTPTADEIADRVVEKLTPEAEVPEVVSELSPEDQRHYAIFAQMVENDPGLKELPEKFVEFAKAKYEYEKKWKKENPGKEFDPLADEHEEFFKTQPQFNEEAYDEAKIDLRVKSATEREVQKRLSPLEERQHAERIEREVEPKLRQAVTNDAHTFIKGVSPEIAAMLTDKDGHVDWSPANLARAEAHDPVAAKILVGALKSELLPVLDTLHRVFTPGLNFSLNPQIPLHKRVIDEITFFEQSMSEASDELKMRAGKQFCTINQWEKMAKQIASSKSGSAAKESKYKELDAKYWTVDMADIRSVVSKDVSARVKNEIEELNRIGSKKFGTPATEHKAPVVETPPKPAVKPVVKVAEKPSPPSGPTGGVQVSAVTPVGGGEKKSSEIITEGMFPT